MGKQRVAIIGAGIVGLAHAWSAAERGFDVTVFERSLRAAGASIRNFGMIWPIGQKPGEQHATAMISRSRWLHLGQHAGLWVNPCGSIHLAHRNDEWTVLNEFVAQSESLGLACELMSRREILARTPAANPDGLLGGMFSSTELCVNPREATRNLPRWLIERYGVTFQFETHATSVDSEENTDSSVRVMTSNGDSHSFHRAVICSGAELRSLFPATLEESGLRRCKLQMLSVPAPDSNWNLGTHLASGLTLRHYRSFEICPGLSSLKTRIAEETPELDQYGIHVMASQNNLGEIILGDSHEYGEAIEPFDKMLIDDLILRELRKIIQLPNWTISERWHGVYAKHPDQPFFEAMPLPNVHLCTGTGGAGMTLSFGIAEQLWQRWTGDTAKFASRS